MSNAFQSSGLFDSINLNQTPSIKSSHSIPNAFTKIPFKRESLAPSVNDIVMKKRLSAFFNSSQKNGMGVSSAKTVKSEWNISKTPLRENSLSLLNQMDKKYSDKEMSLRSSMPSSTQKTEEKPIRKLGWIWCLVTFIVGLLVGVLISYLFPHLFQNKKQINIRNDKKDKFSLFSNAKTKKKYPIAESPKPSIVQSQPYYGHKPNIHPSSFQQPHFQPSFSSLQHGPPSDHTSKRPISTFEQSDFQFD